MPNPFLGALSKTKSGEAHRCVSALAQRKPLIGRAAAYQMAFRDLSPAVVRPRSRASLPGIARSTIALVHAMWIAACGTSFEPFSNCMDLNTDPAPPRLSDIHVTEPVIEPSDSFRIRFRARDYVLDHSVISWNGSFDGNQRIVHSCAQDILVDLYQIVPRDALLDTTLNVSITTFDWYGNVDSVRANPIWITDSTPPVFSGPGVLHPHLVRPNDTISFSASATDNHQLTWFGFEVPGAADSINASGNSASGNFTLVVPSNATLPAHLGGFARDVAGNRGSVLN